MTRPVVEVNADDEDERGRRHGLLRHGLLAPALANLALGVPAILPLYLTYWLWTEYAPLSCDAFATRPDMSNCDYHTLDHAPVMMFLLALTGALLLILLLAVDVLGPRARGDARPGRWLAMATLIPVPFLVLLCLAKA
ncbi:hypothetical protein QQM39_28685 [Streptomyces sp. DT2A-34]|uniref:hypothetical protein n=1 Tax=Streptomyces sp. DT2A-34 TaxID=3051182 RepID=UPI00265BFD8D|nr:hypothetical protein [Streptomyces sp. DT2A-34]MDO0914663.1 hypothetical protein [Streptomyces sp. DT2A-34]